LTSLAEGRQFLPNLALNLVRTARVAMEFEVIAKCHTTKARVSRMKLARKCALQHKSHLYRRTHVFPDGVTMLPTFMPVATQAAIKGLTSQQMEALGVTLILNNTYHLNLRPGLKVLDAAGGAHKFQGWNRNLLTVRVPSTFQVGALGL